MGATYTSNDYALLMEEPPDGYNHGRAAGTSSDDERKSSHRSLDGKDWQVLELYRDGGYAIAWPGDMGTRGNRDVLAPDEFVNFDVLQPLVEERLGFTYAEVKRVYGLRGQPSRENVRIRNVLDARILELYDAGANMFKFAEVVGMKQRTMNRAVARAKGAEA